MIEDKFFEEYMDKIHDLFVITTMVQTEPEEWVNADDTCQVTVNIPASALELLEHLAVLTPVGPDQYKVPSLFIHRLVCQGMDNVICRLHSKADGAKPVETAKKLLDEIMLMAESISRTDEEKEQMN